LFLIDNLTLVLLDFDRVSENNSITVVFLN